MATPLDLFRVVAPEFAAESDATVNAVIALVPYYINVDLYQGDQQSMAIALKAASLMLTRSMSASGSSGGGVVTEEKEGDLSRKFSSSQSAKITTDNIYEQQLAALSAGVSGVGVMTRINVPGFAGGASY